MRASILLLLAMASALGCSSTGGEGQGGAGSASTGTGGAGSTSTGTGGGGGDQDAGDCAADHYRAWPSEVCGVGLQGTPSMCMPRAEHCSVGASGPVCGCDGKMYQSWCAANTAGVDVNDKGGCTPPAGMFACGHGFCTVASEYCDIELSDTVDPNHHACAPLPPGCSPAACACLSLAVYNCSCITTPEGGLVRSCAL